jgi:hypothetical protein
MIKFFKFLFSFLLKQEQSLEDREILVPIQEENDTSHTMRKFNFSLLDKVNSGIVIVTRTNILYINKVLLDMLEYEEHEIRQDMKGFLNEIFLMEKDNIFSTFKRVLNSSRDISAVYDTSLKTKHSDFIPVSIKITKLKIEDEDALLISCNNSTELVNQKNLLAKRQKQVDTLFNMYPVSLLINDYSALYKFIKQQNFSSVDEVEAWAESKTIEQLKAFLLNKIKTLGINKTALKHSSSIGGAISGVMLDDKDDIIFLLKHLFLKRYEFSTVVSSNNDEVKYSWIIPNSAESYDECVEYVLVFSSKITSALEQRLEDSVLKAYKDILQWQNDNTGRIIFCNSNFFEVFLKDYPYPSIVSMQYDGFNFDDLMNEAKNDESARCFIKRIKPANSEEKWLNVWYYPIIGVTAEQQNEIIGYIGIAIDITKFSTELELELRTYIYEGKLTKISSDSYKFTANSANDSDNDTEFKQFER